MSYSSGEEKDYSSEDEKEYNPPNNRLIKRYNPPNNKLINAIRNGDDETIQKLTDDGVEIKPSEFSEAVRLGNLDVIRALLYNGAITSFNDLIFAISRGLEEVIEEFIDSGIDVNGNEDLDMGKALEATVYINEQYKRLNILGMLLSAGAIDPEGTALELHAVHSDNESVGILLDHLDYKPIQVKIAIDEAISYGKLHNAFELALYLNNDNIINNILNIREFNLNQNNCRAAIRHERPDIALRIAVIMRNPVLVRHLFDDLGYEVGPEAIEIAFLAGRLNLPDLEEYILSKVEMLP